MSKASFYSFTKWFSLHPKDAPFDPTWAQSLCKSLAASKIIKEWQFTVEKVMSSNPKDLTGYHAQGYVLFDKARPFHRVLDKFHKKLGHIGCGVSLEALRAYTAKTDTYVLGPFKSTDHQPDGFETEKNEEAKMLIERTPHPWQQSVLDWIGQKDARKIYWIYDSGYNHGKSYLADYLEDYKDFTVFNQMKGNDVRAAVGMLPNDKCRRFLFDLPATKEVDISIRDLYAALETLKNGRLWATKGVLHKHARRVFKRPFVIVLSNSLPAWRAMDPERWVVYSINQIDLNLQHVPKPNF